MIDHRLELLGSSTVGTQPSAVAGDRPSLFLPCRRDTPNLAADE